MAFPYATAAGTASNVADNTGKYSYAAVPGATGAGIIPTLFSAKVLEKFYDSSVLAVIANTDYDGELSSQGDKVVIRTRPTIDISEYKTSDKLAIDRPVSAKVELNIDKGFYWNTVIDDVHKVQSDLNLLNLWSMDAAEQLKIKIDASVLATILAGVDATNKGATAGRVAKNLNFGTKGTRATSTSGNRDNATITGRPVHLTKDNMIDHVIDMGQALDEQNIPETGRWLVLPAWACSLIKKSELRDASVAGDSTSISRNGRVGMIDRFTVYKSNLLPKHGIHAGSSPTATGKAAFTITDMFAGHNHGLTFATQLTKMETLRSESTFGDITRGLQIFGSKVVDGRSIVGVSATPYDYKLA